MKPLPRGFIIGGLILFFAGPLAGLFLTVLGMVGAFKELGTDGIGDPKGLAGHIGVVLVATEAGFVAAALGIVLVAVGAISHYLQRRSEGNGANGT